MADKTPTKARIRSYNVGFGDCFLLTFSYPGDEQHHVLIDFGTTKKADDGPEGGMLEIAGKIREHTAGKLDIVVATHRHTDHISGFRGKTGEIIAALEPELVIQPWTEDPKLEPDARAPAAVAAGPAGARALVSRLADMHTVAVAALAEAPKLELSPSVRRAVREQLAFLGETNLSNAEAVKNLMTMGKRPAVYANFGTQLPIADLLPGVGVQVLGPPSVEQSAAIKRQRDEDPDEFWHLAAASADTTMQAGEPPIVFPQHAISTDEIPQEARWVIPEIERMRSEEMLAIVRILDSALNNTSLILLFEVGDTRLLFPGDAQIENWSYALKTAPGHEKIQQLLASASFYKVGHHGSLNATPKTLWEKFEHRSNEKSAPGRLRTMVSTAADKHGHKEDNTEVPRRTLIKALTEESELHNTQDILSPTEFWDDVEFDF